VAKPYDFWNMARFVEHTSRSTALPSMHWTMSWLKLACMGRPTATMMALRMARTVTAVRASPRC
jgi:hypothetical protein